MLLQDQLWQVNASDRSHDTRQRVARRFHTTGWSTVSTAGVALRTTGLAAAVHPESPCGIPSIIMIQTIALLVFALVLQPAAPKAGPWKSLFDGKTMSAWRIFKTDNAPKMCDAPGAKDCWEIANGVLRKDGDANDVASKEQFGDFELELEWKIGDASNSGVFYRGTDEFDQITGAHPSTSCSTT